MKIVNPKLIHGGIVAKKHFLELGYTKYIINDFFQRCIDDENCIVIDINSKYYLPFSYLFLVREYYVESKKHAPREKENWKERFFNERKELILKANKQIEIKE